MGSKLLWAGLTLFVILPSVGSIAGLTLAGLVMLVGLILLLLDK